MKTIELLNKHGLFDAKVPRYTSYPPANHFETGIGLRRQGDWLQAVPQGADVSVYVHIPFCKRLCWFCACRTQGTKTLRPVDAYVEILKQEIAAIRGRLPASVRMARLHLGGGTPTILSLETMDGLIDALFDAFERAPEFEFSVEIDPTEASDELLALLADRGMNRASIGVQDFAPEVQEAIGRPQTLEQTRHVCEVLRKHGVHSLNMDLLYGLPKQTTQSFQSTIDKVLDMNPDRLAIYGYAHVPWMSKRQVMIKSEDLPDARARFDLACQAKHRFVGAGYRAIGIDHFARPTDSLAIAAETGHLSRNFQGYTTDTATTLIGFGASAISRFDQGYVQNAVATSAYQERVQESGGAAHKGYEMSEHDRLIARMVEGLMCKFALDQVALCQDFPEHASSIRSTLVALMRKFPGALMIGNQGIQLQEEAQPLARIIAKCVDDFSTTEESHSAAI